MFMLRRNLQAAPGQRGPASPGSQMLARAERSWKTLENAKQPGAEIDPYDCLSRLEHADQTAARDPGLSRAESNAATAAAMRAAMARRTAMAAIDDRLKAEASPALEDIGQAERARAALLRTTANDLIDHVDPAGRGLVNHAQAQNHRMVLRTAERHEIRAVSALHGREGLAARTGLSGDELDQLVARSNAQDLLSRHEREHAARIENKSAQESPAEAWQRKAATLSAQDFNTEVCKARADFIDTALPPDSSDRDKRIERNTLLRVHREAEAAGATSGPSLKLNQGILKYAPEESEARRDLLALRDTCLAERKRQRSAQAERS